MLSFALLATVASALPSVLHKNSARDISGLSHVNYGTESCSSNPDADYFSCQAPGTVSSLSCCYENYGVIVQTQFWDYDTSLLRRAKREVVEDDEAEQVQKRDPSDVDTVFTIHGLWDDLCDGSYQTYCNPDWEFSSPDDVQTAIVDTFGRQDLYDTMIKYWINNLGGDEGSISLWEHEYNKHGTCFNTLAPSCFTGSYQQYENAIAYYQKVVEVWSGLTTYEFLASAGITPSTDQQYDLLDVQNALANSFGGNQVYVGCTDGAINQIYYYYNVQGNALTGTYEQIASLTDSNCPDQVWYIPKN